MKKGINYILFIALLFIGTIVKAAPVEVNDSYNGDYSINYLIKHYNAITFGQKNNILPRSLRQNVTANKGDIKDIPIITGPVLVNGNYTSTVDGNFADNNNYVSYIKGTLGSNLQTNSKRATKENYVDFKKLYARVANESQMLYESADETINSFGITINEPGVYNITNTNDTLYVKSPSYISNYDVKDLGIGYQGTNIAYNNYVKIININNYNPNKIYVFNFNNEFVTTSFLVKISNSSNGFVNFLAHNGNFTNNIIFNFPNAKYIDMGFICGTIIAPKADIYIRNSGDYKYYDSTNYNPDYNSSRKNYYKSYGTVIANSITGTTKYNTDYNSTNSEIAIPNLHYVPNITSENVLNAEGQETIEEPTDYDDDVYTGEYTLKELLERYSVVSFGKKDYESNAKIKNETSVKGSVKMFHIAGPFLIKGNYNVTRNDLENNGASVSYIGGSVYYYPYGSNQSGVYSNDHYFSLTKFWGSIANYELSHGSINNVYLKVSSNSLNYYSNNGQPADDQNLDYINMDRLYNRVTEQAKDLENGIVVNKTGKINLTVGKNYIINDISEINEIVFDNFAENKNKTTTITIKNSGTVNFPLISKDTGNYKGITTNDYFGKKEATYTYEIGSFAPDTYYGNIVWNLPNATFIKYNQNAPFAGHLIAPKADVELGETHFSGCFIVNSLYAEGNTEAHFYPLTKNLTYTDNYKAEAVVDENKGSITFDNNLDPKDIPEGQEVSFTVKARDGYRVFNIKIEDENGNLVDYVKVNEDGEYKFIMPSTNVVITATYKEKEEEDESHRFLEGMGQDFNLRTNNNLRFRVSIPYEDFTKTGKVYIDDELIDCKCYDLTEGSTIITFKDECSKKIKTGNHTIITTLENGTTCETNFTISDLKNPNTKDVIPLVIILMIIAAGTMYILRRKNMKKFN